MSLLGELNRRNVFRVAVLYAVSSWVLLQVEGLLFPMLSVPDWGQRLLMSSYTSRASFWATPIGLRGSSRTSIAVRT